MSLNNSLELSVVSILVLLSANSTKIAKLKVECLLNVRQIENHTEV